MKRLVLLLLLLCRPGWAEPPLFLEEAQERAVSTSPVLREYRARTSEAIYRVDEAYTQVRPTLNLAGNYTHLDPAARALNIPVQQPDNFSATLVLRQAIYTFGRLKWSAASTELTAQASRAELAREEAKVREDAALAYYDVMLGQEAVRIAEANVVSREAHLADARKLESAGVAAHFDVVRDEAALAKAGQGVLEARNRFDVARARLLILLSLPRETVVALPEQPQPSPPPTVLPLERALTERPEMKAAAFATDAARARVELAEAQDNPSLFLQTDYTNRTAVAFFPANQWTAGLYLQIPLFDGGLTEARSNQAREVVVQLESIADNLRRQISLEVESLYLDLTSRWQRVAVAVKEAEAATEAARVARLRYFEGISSNVERLDAETAQTSALLDLATARYQYLAGLARWRRAVP